MQKFHRQTVLMLTFVLFSVLFLATAEMSSYYFRRNNQNPKLRIEKIQKQIEQLDRKAQTHLKILDSLYRVLPVSDLFNQKSLISDPAENFTSLFVFKGDSLEFWSDNSVSVSGKYKKIKESQIAQLGNGWYRILTRNSSSGTFVACYLLQHTYPYENDYLNDEFNPGIDPWMWGEIREEKGRFNITAADQSHIFSVEADPGVIPAPVVPLLPLLSYLCFIVSIMLLVFYGCRQISTVVRRPKIFLPLFIIILTGLRTLMFVFRFPANLYELPLFSPNYYAASEILPSFGDLIINVALFLIITVVTYRHRHLLGIRNVKKKHDRLILQFLISGFSAMVFFVSVNLIYSIVIDSTINYNLAQLLTLDLYSLAGLLVICSIMLSAILLLLMFLQITEIFKNGALAGIIITGIQTGVFCFVNPVTATQNPALLAAFFLFCTVFYIARSRGYAKFRFYEIILYILIVSFSTSQIIISSNAFRESERRKFLARKISTGDDPLAEFIFKGLYRNMISDPGLRQLLAEYPGDETQIREHLMKNYFNGYWDKYKIQITVCNSNDSLVIEPMFERKSCLAFFGGLIYEIGKPAAADNLFLLNYGTGGTNYLSILKPNEDTSSATIFIEMNSRFIAKGLGYPELLTDKKLFLNTDLTHYSYARYFKNTLVDAYGKYYYSINIDPTLATQLQESMVKDINGYNHLYYRTDPQTIVVISRKNGNFLDTLAPFSILLSFFVVFIIITYLLLHFPPRISRLRLNFRGRLQVSMISIIVISFVVVGISTYFLIRNLNENKNIDILSEKAMSILTELQDKLSGYDTMSPEQQAGISGFLVKLSNVFFTDINVFDTRGNLVSSSRPQIFTEGLLSTKMNPVAFNQLRYKKKTLFIQKERIGLLNYYSAYVPLYGRDNEELYFINLPYFARENELKKELTTFLMTFINIYVFLIGITVMMALFVAGRITRPLQVIREHLGKVKLGPTNEKIKWPSRDEIGGLIEDYNRMIDELAGSAERLARSERESAWREMAMQVAHEIKNPLTPMKLSVQYLEKAWHDKAPDWDERLKRFTRNLIEQIDALSAIASEFSYFAKMPKPEREVIDIEELILNVAAIFRFNPNIKILINNTIKENILILADRKQIIRVFNNLINNSVQAIGAGADGVISVTLGGSKEMVLINISDNGSGIPDEMKPKIFVPNFSTKTEGMGLGLAMVKAIIENSGGSIRFESEEGQGTTFFVVMPRYESAL